MEIINASAKYEKDQQIDNPAINHGGFSEVEDDLHAAKSANQLPSEVPELRVNGVEIAEAKVLAEMQYHPATTKRQSMVKAAESLIIGELIKQKARQLNVPFDELAPEAQLEFQLVNQLIDRQGRAPKATEQECERFYLQNKEKFRTSPLLEVRHILLAVSPDDISERMRVKEVAQEVIETLSNSPDSFDELVVNFSDCLSKTTKGNLGQISQGQTMPEFERHLFKAEEGLINYPIETRYGFHVVFVDRKVEGTQLPFDYVKNKITDYLNEKVQRKNIAQYIQQLIQEADIIGFDFDYDDSPLMQ